MSIDYYEPKEQYYCNFKINLSLRRRETIILQYSKDFPFYFPKDNVENIRTNGVALQDSFPVIAGRYGLTILLQNSVGKEFSVFEKEIVVPEETASPQIIGPLIGYKIQDNRASVHAPFKVLEKQVFVDPTNTLALRDELSIYFTVTNVQEDLWKSGTVDVIAKGSREKDPFQKSFVLKLADYSYNKLMGLSSARPAREFPPDYYQLTLDLKDGNGRVMDRASSQFIISPEEAIPHPVTLAKSFPLANSFLYFYSLAYQYDKINNPQSAEANFAKAMELRPDYAEGIVEYAGFLLKEKKHQESLDLIERVKNNDKVRFDYYLIKGQAQAGLGQFADAIVNLLEGNKMYNSDTRLLNTLGRCYFQTGDKARALQALKASLSLNPDQKEIQDLVNSLGK
jgi:tetratricopeptide (TPR) repeat protein